MRSYYIDEIPAPEMEKARDYLKAAAVSSKLENLFWITIPEDLLTASQFQHTGCRPHAFAVETGTDWVKFEFFIRSLTNIQCTCPDYGTKQQREFIIHFAHNMMKQLQIST